jgi:hypothetical protein
LFVLARRVGQPFIPWLLHGLRVPDDLTDRLGGLQLMLQLRGDRHQVRDRLFLQTSDEGVFQAVEGFQGMLTGGTELHVIADRFHGRQGELAQSKVGKGFSAGAGPFRYIVVSVE